MVNKNTTLSFLLLLVSIAASFAQTALPTSWNFSTPAITSPPNGWTLNNTLPASTGGQTYAFGIGDNVSCRFDAAGENLIIQFGEKPGPLSYYVSPQNAGAAWSGQFDVQESADGNSWSTVRSFTSQATTTTNFTNGKNTDTGLKPTSRFVRFIFTTKGVGNFALDSVLLLKAQPAPNATINIKKATSTALSGSTVVIGNQVQTALTVENNGTVQALRIDSVVFSGPAATDFSAPSFPININANSSATLNVNFTAGPAGSRKGTMYVYSNDSLNSPYVLNLYAISGLYATEPPAQPTGLTFANVSAYRFNVGFTAPTTKAEKYLVLIQNGGTIVDVPIDGNTYRRGDRIGLAKVLMVLDSPTLIVPNYILANSTYQISVFSANGPAGYENYKTTSPLNGQVTTLGKQPGSYYAGITPGSASFVSSLSQKINPHDTIYYSNYIVKLVTPWLAQDTAAGKKLVKCAYTNFSEVYDDPFQWNASTNTFNLTREHTYCQSWMPSNVGNASWPNAPGTNTELPEYNDLHHLFPVHQLNANGKRSNYPYGEVVTPTYVSPTGEGKLGLDSNNKTVYEPRNDQKGNSARALFYMAVCYNGVNGKNWSIPSQQNIEVLKKWNMMDQPDNFEIARHEYIYSLQRNRNPFIDNPTWAAYINFSNMSSIVDTTKILQLTQPNAATTWKSGSSLTIKWLSLNIDSVNLLLSVDSGITFTQVGGTYAGNADSVIVNPALTVKSKFGRVVARSKDKTKSDTSAFFSISNANGLKEVYKDFQVEVFPNPVNTGILTIQSDVAKEDCQLELMDYTGKVLLRKNLEASQNIDIGDKANGIYLLYFYGKNVNKLIKVIKE